MPQILELKQTKRSRSVKISLYKIFCYILYELKIGCQWYSLQIDYQDDKSEISWNTVYQYFNKWSKLEVLKKVFEGSLASLNEEMDIDK